METIGMVFGLLLCFIACFLLYKRISLILFGKRANGRIIGYGNRIDGYKGVDTYSYKVEYEYENRKHIAYSAENLQVPRGGIPRENLRREVTVYFSPKKPQTVTIFEMRQTERVGIVIFIIGIFTMLLSAFL